MKNTQEIQCLDRELQNYLHDCLKLAELKNDAEKDPGNEQRNNAVRSLQLRIEVLASAFALLDPDDIDLLYYHFECGQTYRQMECHIHYSYRTIHEKIRKILKRISDYPYIV